MCGKIGLSPGPNPNCHHGPRSPRPSRFTASTYSSVCTSKSSSSVASRARVSRTRSPSMMPAS